MEVGQSEDAAQPSSSLNQSLPVLPLYHTEEGGRRNAPTVSVSVLGPSSQGPPCQLAKRLQASTITELAEWLDCSGPSEGRALRCTAKGILGSPLILDFLHSFQRMPVWLLSLDAEMVSRLWLVGVANYAEFQRHLSKSGGNSELFMAALTNVGLIWCIMARLGWSSQGPCVGFVYL